MPSRLWGDLQPGKYDVGLRLVRFVDTSRPNKDGSGRTIEVFVWYPAAKPVKVKSLTFAEYYLLSEKELRESELPEALSKDVTGDRKGITAEMAESILDSPMRAHLNSKQADGRFPIILWSSRHLTVIAQSVLSEYLASHGYVVAFPRYQGEPIPFPFQINEPETKLEVLDTHVQDLAFALSNLRDTSGLERAKTALISWSYGGESAIKLQLRQPDIDAVLGLSSIRFDRGPYQGKFSVEPRKLNVPYVLLKETINPNGEPELVPSHFFELPAESYYVELKELRHGNFNVLEGFIPGLFKIKKVQNWSKNDGSAQLGYETICRLSLGYLNHFLKGRRLKLPQSSALPEGFLKIHMATGRKRSP